MINMIIEKYKAGDRVVFYSHWFHRNVCGKITKIAKKIGDTHHVYITVKNPRKTHSDIDRVVIPYSDLKRKC